jgi:hypothetical protein
MVVDRPRGCGSRDQSAEQDVWRTEPSGDLSMVVRNLRLIIRKCSGFTRFLVLKRAAHGRRRPEAFLSSGMETNVDAAKLAAKRTATRLETVLANRGQRNGRYS